LIAMPSGRPNGRNGTDWTKKLCVLATVIAIAGAVAVGRARADDSLSGLAIAAQAQNDAAAAVATAIATSSAALAQAQAQTQAAGIVTMTAGETVAPAAAIVPATTDLRPTEPAPPTGAAAEHTAPPKLATPRQSRPRALPQVRGRPTERNALAAPAPRRLPVRLGVAPRSASGTPTGSREERRPTAPSRPAPLSPPTRTPPDNPGVSWSGQSGGQGAFPTPLPAAIAGFLLLAMSFALRRVIWWAPDMPRRLAPTPWRPG
jgi:hypothetical protein